MAIKELKDSEKVLIMHGLLTGLEAQNHDNPVGKAIKKILTIAFPEDVEAKDEQP